MTRNKDQWRISRGWFVPGKHFTRENYDHEKNRSHDFAPIVDDPLLSICLSRFCIIPVV